MFEMWFGKDTWVVSLLILMLFDEHCLQENHCFPCFLIHMWGGCECKWLTCYEAMGDHRLIKVRGRGYLFVRPHNDSIWIFYFTFWKRNKPGICSSGYSVSQYLPLSIVFTSTGWNEGGCSTMAHPGAKLKRMCISICIYIYIHTQNLLLIRAQRWFTIHT